MRSGEPLDQGPAQPTIHVDAAPGSASVTVPNGAFLLTADFVRQGDDLLLRGQGPEQQGGQEGGHEGPDILLHDYFAGATPPDLVTTGGATISGELAARLAGPLAPGQYAQIQTAQATDGGGDPVGEVTELSGSVLVTRTNGAQQALTLGDPVYLGDVLQTGPDTSVGIRFVDDTLFSLSSNARLVIDQVIYNPDGADNALSLSLIQGAFAFVSGGIAPADGPGMSIRTPVATIGVRGTTGAGEFQATLQRLVVSLLEGLDGELGAIDVFNSVSLQTLAGALDTLTVSSATEVLPPPSQATESQLAIYSLALGSLSRSFLDLIQEITPEAGPEQEGGSGGSGGAILADFLNQTELSATITAPDESGELQEFTVEVDERTLADILARDPNLILLLQDLADLTIIVDLDGAVTPGGPAIDGESDFSTQFVEGGEAIPIGGNIAVLSVSGIAISAVVTLEAPVDAANESLFLAGPLPAGITLAPGSTATTLILTGSASTAVYQEALALVRYLNTSENPADRMVTVEISDGTSSFVATTSVDGVPINDAPQANDDGNAVGEGAAVVVGNVLGGAGAAPGDQADIDVDGDTPSVVQIEGAAIGGGPIAVIGVTQIQGQFGTLIINPNGSYSYLPDSGNPLVDALDDGDVLTDSFIYTISDGELSSSATLDITINGVTSPLLVVGSNEDDQAGSGEPHLVPNRFEAGSGAMLGDGDDDVLIGDPGGATAVVVNLVLVVDVSGSMNTAGRLDTAKAALQNLLDIYGGFAANGAQVNVQIIPFADNVQAQGSFDLSSGGLQAAIAFVNALTAVGGTDYIDALNAIRAYLGDLGATPPGDLNEVYFLSDGIPSQNPAAAIGQFQDFVADYQDAGGPIQPGAPLQVHAVAIGQDASLTQLDQIDNSDGAQVVLDGGDLTAALESTVKPLPGGGDSITGNGGDDVVFGDALNTDHLASNAFGPAGTHDGAGFDALVAFLTDNALAGTAAGQAPTPDQIAAYIRDNAASFVSEDGTQGGDDSLAGNAGNDTLFGMGGDDVLRGGEGDDLLVGGGGQDSFVFSLAEPGGSDEIADFEVGAGGDTLRLEDVFDYDGGGVTVADLDSGAAAADGWAIADNGTDVTVTLGNSAANSQGGGQITLAGIGNGSINSFAAFDAVADLSVNA